MAGTKRKALTTDDLLRRQEESAKRRRPSLLGMEANESDSVGDVYSEDSDEKDESVEKEEEEDDDDDEEVDGSGPSRDSEDAGDSSEEDSDADDRADGDEHTWRTTADSLSSSRITFTHNSPLRAPARVPHTAPSRPMTFPALDISPLLVSALSTMSIRAPTEIQRACIPPLLEGKYFLASRDLARSHVETRCV